MQRVAIDTGRAHVPKGDPLLMEGRIEAPVVQALRAHIKRQENTYEALAVAAGFSIQFGERTCFDHENQTVIIGLWQLMKRRITNPIEFDLLVLHELGHFKELAEDPAGYHAVLKEGKRDDGNGKLYFGFYNALMDIYVNRNTRNRADQFSSKEEVGKYAPEVLALYREKAFPERDFSSLPRCQQYGYYLLNLGMEVGDDITLSPEVQNEIDRGVNLFGIQHTYEEFINTFLVPAIGLRKTDGWRATIGQRKAIIDQTLRLVFERFLEEDKKDGSLERAVEFEYLEGIEPSPEDLENAYRVIKERQTEENKTPKERARELAEKQARSIAAEGGLNKEEEKDFSETLQRVQPIIHELVQIFKLAVRDTIDFMPNYERGYRRGTRLNVGDVISQFPTIQTDPNRATVMERREYEEGVTRHPSKVRLWVVPDLSGSMGKCEQTLKEITLALSAALTTLNVEKKLGQHELGGSLNVTGFHESAVPIIPIGDTTSLLDVAKGYKMIKADGSKTSDHRALEHCLKEVRQVKRPDDDVIDILIEITDGHTSNPRRSEKVIEILEKEGLTLIAFYLQGEQGGPEQFHEVWNSKGKQRGEVVKKAEDILPGIRKRLGQFFEGV